MCDKVLCYDRILGRYWRMDVTDLDKLIISMNTQLSCLGHLSINDIIDIIDIINGYLPNDKKMQMVKACGDQFGFLERIDNISYKYSPIFVPAIDGQLVVDLGFDPVEDEEQ